MKTCKWENLKIRIAKDQYTRINSAFNAEAGSIALIEALIEGHQNWRGKQKELAEEVYQRIMRWDIRCAQKLLDLFKGYAPKSLELTGIDMDEDGEWVLTFA